MSLVTSSGKYLFWLYLVISGNYLGNLFGCRVQELFTNNMIVKNILGFLTFYFFVTLADASSPYSQTKRLVITLITYIVFILTTRMHHKYWIGMIIPLGISYILQIVKDTYKDNNTLVAIIDKVQLTLVILSFIILIIGVVYYYGEKKIEYGVNFSAIEFFIGKPTCKLNTKPQNVKTIDVFKRAFT